MNPRLAAAEARMERARLERRAAHASRDPARVAAADAEWRAATQEFAAAFDAAHPDAITDHTERSRSPHRR